ncbi:MAG: VOC family protein [Pseudomonadales bacterium]
MANRISWIDIPVADLGRAIKFYSRVLDVEVIEKFPGVAVISFEEGEISGCLYTSDADRPSKSGVLLYFNVDGRVQDAKIAAKDNGGEIVEPVHEIGTFG